MNNHYPASCDYDFYSSLVSWNWDRIRRVPSIQQGCSHFRERLHAVGTVYLVVMDVISLIHHHIQSAVLPKFIKTRVRLCFTNDARAIVHYKSQRNTIQGNKNLDVKPHTPCCMLYQHIYSPACIHFVHCTHLMWPTQAKTAVVHLCIKIQLLTSGSVGKTLRRPVVLLLAVFRFLFPYYNAYDSTKLETRIWLFEDLQ